MAGKIGGVKLVSSIIKTRSIALLESEQVLSFMICAAVENDVVIDTKIIIDFPSLLQRVKDCERSSI